MKRNMIHYQIFTVGSGGALHKKCDKHEWLDLIIPELVNGSVFEDNKRKLGGLSGINGIIVVETIDGLYVSQISGYNGNLGMFGFLVEPNGSLTRFC